MLRIRTIGCFAAAFCLSGTAIAQNPADAEAASPTASANQGTIPGYQALGDEVFRLNIEEIPNPGSINAARGVEYAFGFWWVCRNTPAREIDKYDVFGNLLNTYPQMSTGGTFAHRDGVADEANNKLYFGEDTGRFLEYDYDPSTGDIAFSQLFSVTTDGVTTVGTVRQLGRDPVTGLFYTGSFGGPVYSFDPATAVGGVITVAQTFTNPSAAFYGFGWDETSNTIWGWYQAGAQAQEYTINTGASTMDSTGRMFDATALGGIAGGADWGCDPRNPGFESLITVHQGDGTLGGPPDYELAVYDLADANGLCNCFDPVVTYCTAKSGLVCGTPAVSSTGAPSASATSGFELSAGPARQNRSGLYLYTDAGRANFPFQGGILCISPPLKRTVPITSGGASACDGVFTLDMAAFASGNLGGNPDPFLQNVGQQVNSQCWGRDSVATGSFLSDALEWIVCP